MRFPSPIPITVRGPALRPERCRPTDRHLDVDITSAETIRVFVMGAESTWVDMSPEAARDLAGRLVFALDALGEDYA